MPHQSIFAPGASVAPGAPGASSCPSRRAPDAHFRQASLFDTPAANGETPGEKPDGIPGETPPPASDAPTTTHPSARKASQRQPPPAPQIAPHPSRTTTAAPQLYTIQLRGATVPYTLKVSPRARRIRFIIRPTGALEVVAPRGVTLSRIEDALRQKARWILTTQARMAERSGTASAPEPLGDGRELLCAGRTLRLRIVSDPAQLRPGARLLGETLMVMTPTPTQETLHAALEAWYRHEARRVIGERLALWNARYGFTYQRVAIKEQKTRWGSCSRQGNLNFNWRLLLAPLPVLDYVLIHELAHLQEQNHGQRFWALVAQLCPEYRELRRWLRDHGQELRF